MSVQLLLWIIATVIAAIAIFVQPPRANLIAASLAFGWAGFVAGALPQ